MDGNNIRKDRDSRIGEKLKKKKDNKIWENKMERGKKVKIFGIEKLWGIR